MLTSITTPLPDLEVLNYKVQSASQTYAKPVAKSRQSQGKVNSESHIEKYRCHNVADQERKEDW